MSSTYSSDARRVAANQTEPLPTNAFSKKIENHAHAISLHFMHYNFCRTHVTLPKRYGKPTTPAMAAGITTYPWSLTQLAELLD